jgi:hypothetical protein
MNRLERLFFDKTSSTNLQFGSLDGLRGIAVLFVVLSHLSNAGFNLTPVLNFAGSGKYGVFLFFVLSAFLLTFPLIDRNAAQFADAAWSASASICGISRSSHWSGITCAPIQHSSRSQ